MFISDKIQNETTQYAKSELSAYLIKIAGIGNQARITLDLIDRNNDKTMSDDRYIIEITDGKGFIKGSNSRSILLGVYAYLKHLGCRFLRPGKNGEIIPKNELIGECSIDKTAFYPYRVEVMEGAINEEIVLEVLSWLPKAGYNGYYIQYVTPHIFLKRWYLHELNPFKEPEEFSYEDAEEATLVIEKFAKKLGLQLWEIGHGFMFYPFGMNYGPEWTNKLSEEAKPYVALVNGKREISGGHIAYTNLCYTNPVVRKKLTQYLVEFMKKKPYIDVIDLCFADGFKNHCTCDECMKMSVSDIYAQFLNDVDAAFTAEGIDVKIKLSVYVDTRWAPENIRLNNPDRFINSVAAMRSYNESYITTKYEGDLPKPNRTEYISLNSFDYSLRFMDDWQKLGNFSRVIWDYHLYAAHYYDFAGYMKMSALLAEDAKKLKEMNIEGILNCKTQRSAMPTNLPMYSFGAMLFNPDEDYEKLVVEYFDSAFGKLANETKEYLTTLGEIINREILTVKTELADTGGITADESNVWAWKNNPEYAKLFAKVPLIVDEFKALANDYLETEENETVRRSFELLGYHGEIVKRFAKALFFGAIGQEQIYLKSVAELRAYIMRSENKFYLDFDAYLFVRRFINEVVFKDVPADYSACDCADCSSCDGCKN